MFNGILFVRPQVCKIYEKVRMKPRMHEYVSFFVNTFDDYFCMFRFRYSGIDFLCTSTPASTEICCLYCKHGWHGSKETRYSINFTCSFLYFFPLTDLDLCLDITRPLKRQGSGGSLGSSGTDGNDGSTLFTSGGVNIGDIITFVKRNFMPPCERSTLTCRRSGRGSTSCPSLTTGGSEDTRSRR